MPDTAFIIANGYKGHRDFHELLGVDADATAMDGLFRYVVPGFDVVTLRDRSKQSVVTELQSVVSKLEPGDRLWLYFAGHGHLIGREHALIFPEACRRDWSFLKVRCRCR